MNEKLEKAVKEIVNKELNCEECKEREFCKFHEDSCSAYFICDSSLSLGEGIRTTIRHLASIPWNEAVEMIVSGVEENGEEFQITESPTSKSNNQ